MRQTATLWCMGQLLEPKHETILHNAMQSHVTRGAKHTLKAFIIVLKFQYVLLLEQYMQC